MQPMQQAINISIILHLKLILFHTKLKQNCYPIPPALFFMVKKGLGGDFLYNRSEV